MGVLSRVNPNYNVGNSSFLMPFHYIAHMMANPVLCAAASSSSLLHYTKLPDANRAAEEESDREEKMMRQPNNPAGNLLSIRAQDGDFASLTSTSQMKNELLQL